MLAVLHAHPCYHTPPSRNTPQWQQSGATLPDEEPKVYWPIMEQFLILVITTPVCQFVYRLIPLSFHMFND